MVKLLKVPYISLINKNTTTEIAAAVLNTVDRNHIDNAPWKNFPYKPEVAFTLAYGDDCIFLKYYVLEETVLAAHFRTNDPVHLDSCVEFFIGFEGEPRYYNFEFNCIGTCYVAYGSDRNNRELLNEPLINLIKCHSLIRKEHFPASAFYWELTIIIPFEAFGFHRLKSLANERCKVNFYKCGDHLPVPHYLCWNNIHSPSPNFHLPAFFGNAEFVGHE